MSIVILSSAEQISSTSNSIVLSIEEESLKFRKNYNNLIDGVPSALESIVNLWNNEITEFVAGSMKWSIETLETSVNIGIFFITDMFKSMGNSLNIISIDFKNQVRNVNNQIDSANSVINNANSVPFVSINTINRIKTNSKEIDQIISETRNINIQPLILDSNINLDIDIPKPDFDVEILKIPIFSFSPSFRDQMENLLDGYVRIGYVALSATIFVGIYCLVYIVVIFIKPNVKINISLLKSDIFSIEFLVVIGGLIIGLIIIIFSSLIISKVVSIQNNIETELSEIDNHVEKFIKKYNKIIDDGPNFMKNQTEHSINLAIKLIEIKIENEIKNIKTQVVTKIGEVESKTSRVFGIRKILNKIPSSITLGKIIISEIDLSNLKSPVYSIKVLFDHHIDGILGKIFIILSSILITGIILLIVSTGLAISMIRSKLFQRN